MAEEQGWFDFDAVAAAIHDKLVRRHPHVFAATEFATDAERSANWEDQKAQEREATAKRRGSEEPVSVLGDVPKALPALKRASKLGKRASRVGFDWPDAAGIREKVNEELAELDAAQASGNRNTSPKSWATRCSRWSISVASSMWIPKRRCAPRTRNSNAASGTWKVWPAVAGGHW